MLYAIRFMQDLKAKLEPQIVRTKFHLLRQERQDDCSPSLLFPPIKGGKIIECFSVYFSVILCLIISAISAVSVVKFFGELRKSN